MAAAFELSRPEHAGRYELTIYQQGFRLGGKGASGRGAHDRIEEHGLHLWMGFYENAFRLMRECYAEAARDPARCPLSDWRDAFVPSHFSAVADRTRSGAWEAWGANLPAMPGLPGDVPSEQRPRTVADYTARLVALLRTLLTTLQTRVANEPSAATAGATPYPTEPDAIFAAITKVIGYGQLLTFGALLEGLRLLELSVAAFPRYPEGPVTRLLDLITQSVRLRLEVLIVEDDSLRRLWEIADLALACVRGAVRFRLMSDPRGYDAIDDYDCREWLLLNGASQRSVNSAFMRGLYDLGFAYEQGDVARPRISAGQAVRAALRAFFTYRGAFFWKMSAGMGDAVFAPFYEVLRARGVKFAFFHRLRDLKLADHADSPHVGSLRFDVQARVKHGGEYQPLVDVHGIPSWPSGPDFAQLHGGERLCEAGVDFESHWDDTRAEELTLTVGRDFDAVVLAVGIGAVPYVCKDLVARDARWRTMVERVATVQTQAFQIWTGESMEQLGWSRGMVNVSGFVEPFDTWADMSHLATVETHPEQVRAIAYFCSVMADASSEEAFDEPSYPIQKTELVRSNAIQFLERDIGALWPKAVEHGTFRWEVLVGAGQASGPDRFNSQYWRANVNPSDRYTLSLPGTSPHRISPLDPTYDNLTIAGDWTDCGFNEGCVEAAVMSGRLAAHAISGSPPLHEITGYDHP